MTPKAKKLLDIIKRPTSATPERKTGGTDPMEPWSAQNRISESPSLNQYLLSRGFDPKHTPKDIKVAHSKSNQFKLWQQHHVREDLTTGPTGAGVDHKTDLSVSPTKKRLDVLRKAKAHYNIPTPPGTLRKEEVEGVEEGYIGDKIKHAAKSIKRATQWKSGPEMVSPAGTVKAFKNMDGQHLANFVASRKELSPPKKGSARAFANKVIDREMRQRGYGRVAEAGNGRPGTTPGFQDTLAADEKRREQRRQERKAQDKSTMQGINKNRAKADAYRKSGVAEEVELNEHDYFGKEAYAMIKQSQKHHADAQAAKAKGDHAEHERLRKLSSDTHKAAMDKAKEYRADPKNKDAVERSSIRHMSGAAKEYGTGRYMGDSVELDGAQLDEISLGDYKQKAQAQTKELKKHTKGEYSGIVNRMLARRKKGLAMASKREHKIETSSDVTEGWKEKVGAAALAGAMATGAGAKTPKVPLNRAIDNATIVYNNNKFIKKEIEKHKEKASDKQVKNEGVTEADETSWTANSAKFGHGYENFPLHPSIRKMFIQRLKKAGHSDEKISKMSDDEISKHERNLQLAKRNAKKSKNEEVEGVTEEKKDSRSASEKMSDYATKRHKVYQGIADKQKELMKKWNDDHKDEPHLQVPIPEDVGSPMAAIKGVPVPESMAQKIKAMYKKKVAEDTYDSEKDDKYGQNPTFGKKPVMKAIDNKSDRNVDGVKTKAAAVLTGGTTLTGQKRDTVQIDPQLNNPRPGQTDPNGDRSNK